MGLAATSDLALDLGPPSSSPAPASLVVGLVREAAGEAGRVAKLEERIRALEEERRKIEGFRRELPLCMLLVTDAIDGMKGELARSRPVMEEFMPVKRDSQGGGEMRREDDDRDKVNWMSSAQLWSDNHSATNTSSTTSNTTAATNNVSTSGYRKKNPAQRAGGGDDRRVQSDESPSADSDYRNGGGAFLPFRGLPGCHPGVSTKEKVVPLPCLPFLAPATKTPRAIVSPATGDRGAAPPTVADAEVTLQEHLQTSRKSRRCWSPELHRRFVNSLQQLGGAHAATPKQIRELMKVDGLTNDEVKSHLQKYRLHTRKAPASSNSASRAVVVLGGPWLSQEDYPPTKESTSQSGSPHGPLQLLSATAQGGASVMGGDSCEEDGRSESYSWKGHMQRSSGEETD
uniref:Two-component response regulator ARR18 n=1 Tax=Anthurium amnicola TaxID=1678845 RepID=A0A1D1Y7M1_9ARAE